LARAVMPEGTAEPDARIQGRSRVCSDGSHRFSNASGMVTRVIRVDTVPTG